MSAENASVKDLDAGETIRGFISGQKLFGRYTLIKTLGRGGMGVVWLAQDERLGHEVALKFLPELVRSDSAALDDLKHETRRSLQLTHRNIVRIYDFEEDEQSAALAMEYVAGATLSALRVAQQKKVFEPAELTPWVAEVCDALEYAHQKGKIVHRDLKPANLMIGSQGEVKVTDFGIARSISESVSRVSLHPPANGTLGYMSPQQALGKPATVRDDIYSLGATLYELLTSRPPFHSGNIQHQLENVVPPSIAQRRAELDIEGGPIPQAWEATIAACLAKDPAQRPESVSEVRARLLAPPVVASADVPAKAHRSAAQAFRLAIAPALESWTRIPRFTKLAVVAGIVAIMAASSSATYYYAVFRPQAQERERQRVAAVETARREAAEQARLEGEARAAQALAEARLREEAERAAAQRVAAEKAAEDQRAAETQRIIQADREALAQSETQPLEPVAEEGDAMPEEEEAVAPPKATPKKTTRSKSSRSRARPSGFGSKVKRFFGF